MSITSSFVFPSSTVSNQQLSQKVAEKVGEMGAGATAATVQRQPHSQLGRPGFDGGADAFSDLWSFRLSFDSSFPN